MIKNACMFTALCSLVLFTVGCEEEKAPAEEAKAPEAPAAAAEKTAEEKAAEEAAKKAEEEQAKKDAENAAAEAKLQENPLTECCRALAQQAFMQRSPEYKAGEQICGQAMKDEKTLADVKAEIEGKLAGKSLPEPCTK